MKWTKKYTDTWVLLVKGREFFAFQVEAPRVYGAYLIKSGHWANLSLFHSFGLGVSFSRWPDGFNIGIDFLFVQLDIHLYV